MSDKHTPAESPQVSGVTVRVLPDGRMGCASAAAYLGLSEKTLANLRSRGIGPRFCKRGRVFYFKADLDSWLAEGMAQSTAQAHLIRRRKLNSSTDHANDSEAA